MPTVIIPPTPLRKRDKMNKKNKAKKWLILTFCGTDEIIDHTDDAHVDKWAPSSKFVSSSIPSWQILTVHAQPFWGAWDLAFCLKVPLDSLLVWVSSGGSGANTWMRRLAWTFAARIADKYQIRLTWPKWSYLTNEVPHDRTNKMLCLSSKDSDQAEQSLRCPHGESSGP